MKNDQMDRNHERNIKEELLKLLGLDIQYEGGKRDWLYAENDLEGKTEILDLVGAYGINVLGHNHTGLTAFAKTLLDSDTPIFTQLSRNDHISEFQCLFTELLNKECTSRQWSFLHSNTGSESVEVALKIAWLNYQKRKAVLMQQINQCKFRIELEYEKFKYTFSNQLGIDSKQSAIDYYDRCLERLKDEPLLISLKNSFHGKTLGALSAIGNKYFRLFPAAFKSLHLNSDKSTIEDIQSFKLIVSLLHKKTNRLVELSFSPFFGFIYEPIQGEGGLQELPMEWIKEVVQTCKRSEIPIIADEVQSGIYRTGMLAASHHFDIEPDIYCFAKGLGGGVAKLGITVANSAFVDDQIFVHHSSSFAGDYFSLKIATKTLQILQEEKSNQTAEELKSELLNLKKQFPAVIDKVTGMGNMLGLHFKEDALRINYMTKYFYDMNVLGYWLASALLHHEKIRVLPTLSAPLTFRIEPSIYFSNKEKTKTISAWKNLCQAIQNQDYNYLWSHLIDIEHAEFKFNELPLSLKKIDIKPGAAFFICHPVDLPHLRQILSLTQHFSDEKLEDTIACFSSLQTFTPYHITTLKSVSGKERDVVFMGIPLISKSFYQAIRSGNKSMLILKIQDAIDHAESLGASTIGLGQFTSIISENGTLLKSQNARLTSGNAYTVALTLTALEETCKSNCLNLNDLTVALVGASGNILSVMAQCLAGSVRKIILAERKGSLQSKKKLEKIAELLTTLSKKQMGVFASGINDSPIAFNEVFELLQSQSWNRHYAEFIELNDDIEVVQNADVIILGTNSLLPVLSSALVKKGTIVIDVAVPANASTELQNRPDIIYLKGGMAKLPMVDGKQQALNSVIFPFDAGACYACMAETIGLSFDDSLSDGISTIGDLSPHILERIATIMKQQGFELGGLKKVESL